MALPLDEFFVSLPPGVSSSCGLGLILIAKAFFAEACFDRLPFAPTVEELALNLVD